MTRRLIVAVLAAAASLLGIVSAASATAEVPALGTVSMQRQCVAGGTSITTQFSGAPADATMTVRYAVTTGGRTTSSTYLDVANLPIEADYIIPRGQRWALVIEQQVHGRWFWMQDVSVSASSCALHRAARHYTVRPHDTLWRIAVRMYGPAEHAGHQWPRIARANHVHGTRIRVGQVLLIP